MKGTTKRLIAACMTAMMTVGSFGSGVLATEVENESAVAGIAVNFNNYYASSYTPQEDILEYLMPSAQTQTEAGTDALPSAAEVTVKTEGTSLIAEGAAARNTGVIAVLGQLNIREKPSRNAKSLGYLYSNCEVSIYDTVENEEGSWYLVEANDLQGYVSCDYVKTGDAAKVAESGITDKIATVVADSLEAKDSTTDNAQTVGTVYKDEQYAVMEIQGNYVKIKKDDYAVGYVSLDGVKISTQLPEAIAAADTMTAEVLQQYMQDIDYTKSQCLQYMAAGQYESAYYASVYLVELWGYYINDTAYAGMNDLAEAAKTDRQSAIALMDQLEELAAAAPESTESVPETSPDASESSGQESDLEIVIPTEAARVIGIEAFYQGGAKTEGEVVSADELYIRADYSDGTSQYLYNGSGWSCPDVGMILSAPERVITIYYDNYASSFELPVQAAPTAPAETQPAETQPAQTETPVISNRDYRSEIVSYATSWVGRCSYVWAGASLVPGGQVDCSGFTMCVFRDVAGISLPHYSYAQLNCGAAISYEQLRPGDLVFYDRHVAIYIGNGQIVHAKSPSAGIVIDSVFFSQTQPPIGYRSLLP